MPNDWSEYDGYGRARNGSPVSGLIGRKPDWCFEVESGISTSDPPVTYGNAIYFTDDAHMVYAIDANNGKAAWTSDYFKKNKKYVLWKHMTVADRYLSIFPVLFDRISGEVLFDLAQDNLFQKYLENDLGSTGCHGRYIYKALAPQSEQYGFYDIDTKTSREIIFRHGNIVRIIGDTHCLSRDQDALIYSELESGDVVWKIEFDVNNKGGSNTFSQSKICFCDNYVYFAIASVLYKIDVARGAIVWSREILQDKTIDLAVSSNTCLLSSLKFNYALDAKNGHEKWRTQEFLSTSGLMIAGDMTYMQDFSKDIIGFDLHSGKELCRTSHAEYMENSLLSNRSTLLVLLWGGYSLCSFKWDLSQTGR